MNRPLAILTKAVVVVIVGCARTSPHAESNVEVSSAVTAYWEATLNPQWVGESHSVPHWERAFALLHPDVQGNQTLESFNQTQSDMLLRKPGFPWDFSVTHIEVHGDTARANVLVRFGQPGDFGVSGRFVTELKRDDSTWRVTSTNSE
jgi:hypothetical protein